jgi:hypothetical protein
VCLSTPVNITLYSLVVLIGVTLCVSLRHDGDLSSLGKIKIRYLENTPSEVLH